MDSSMQNDSTSPTKQQDPAVVTADPDMQPPISTPVLLNPSPIDVDASEADPDISRLDETSDDMQSANQDVRDDDDAGDDQVDVEEVISVDGSDNFGGKIETHEDTAKHDETIDLTFSPVQPLPKLDDVVLPTGIDDDANIGDAEQHNDEEDHDDANTSNTEPVETAQTEQQTEQHTDEQTDQQTNQQTEQQTNQQTEQQTNQQTEQQTEQQAKTQTQSDQSSEPMSLPQAEQFETNAEHIQQSEMDVQGDVNQPSITNDESLPTSNIEKGTDVSDADEAEAVIQSTEDVDESDVAKPDAETDSVSKIVEPLATNANEFGDVDGEPDIGEEEQHENNEQDPDDATTNNTEPLETAPTEEQREAQGEQEPQTQSDQPPEPISLPQAEQFETNAEHIQQSEMDVQGNVNQPSITNDESLPTSNIEKGTDVSDADEAQAVIQSTEDVDESDVAKPDAETDSVSKIVEPLATSASEGANTDAVDDVVDEEEAEPDVEMEAATEKDAPEDALTTKTESTEEGESKAEVDEKTVLKNSSESEEELGTSDMDSKADEIEEESESLVGTPNSDGIEKDTSSSASEPAQTSAVKITSDQDGDDGDDEMDTEEGEILEGSEGDVETKPSSTPAVEETVLHHKDESSTKPLAQSDAPEDITMKDITHDTVRISGDVEATADDKPARVTFTTDTNPVESELKSEDSTHPAPSQPTPSQPTPAHDANQSITPTKEVEEPSKKGALRTKSEDMTSAYVSAPDEKKVTPGTTNASDGINEKTLAAKEVSLQANVDEVKPVTSHSVKKRVTFSDKAEEFFIPSETIGVSASKPGLSIKSAAALHQSPSSGSSGSTPDHSGHTMKESNNSKDQIVTDTKTPEGHRLIEVINVTCSVKTQKTSTPKKRSSSFRVRLVIRNGTAEFELLNGNSANSGLWKVLNPNQGGPINVRKVRKPPYVMSVVVFDTINERLVENTRLYIHLQRVSYEKLFPLCEYYLMKLPATRPRSPASGPYRSAITSFNMDGEVKESQNNESTYKGETPHKGTDESKIGVPSMSGTPMPKPPIGERGSMSTAGVISSSSGHVGISGITPKTSGLKRHAETGFVKSPSEQQANMKKAKTDGVVSLEERKRMNAQILSDKKKKLLAKMGKAPAAASVSAPSSIPALTSAPTSHSSLSRAGHQMATDDDNATKHPSSFMRPPHPAASSTGSKMNPINTTAGSASLNVGGKPRWGAPRAPSGSGSVPSSNSCTPFGSGPRAPSFKPSPRGAVASSFGNKGNDSRRSGPGILKTIKMKNPPVTNDANDMLKEHMGMQSSSSSASPTTANIEERITQHVEKRLKKLKVEWNESAKKKADVTQRVLKEKYEKDLSNIVKWSISNLFKKHDIAVNASSLMTTKTPSSDTPDGKNVPATAEVANAPVGLHRAKSDNVDDFLARYRTFRPLTWVEFASGSDIDPVECALRGWYNVATDRLRSTDGAEITVDRDALLDFDRRAAELDRVTKQIRGSGHQFLSAWIGQCCPSEFRNHIKNSGKSCSLEHIQNLANSIRTTDIGDKLQPSCLPGNSEDKLNTLGQEDNNILKKTDEGSVSASASAVVVGSKGMDMTM